MNIPVAGEHDIGTTSSAVEPRDRAGTSERANWLVCLGTTRAVHLGLVACPTRGEVPVQLCLQCRLLETVDAEWRRGGCALPED